MNQPNVKNKGSISTIMLVGLILLALGSSILVIYNIIINPEPLCPAGKIYEGGICKDQPVPTPTVTTPVITPTPIIPSNTRAFWNFNENSGNIVRDSSINGNHGTIYGQDVVWTSNGMSGTPAIKFSGLGGYIEIPYSSSLSGGNKISIDVWLKPVLGQRGTVISNYYYNYGTKRNERAYLLAVAADGKIEFVVNSDGTLPGQNWLYSNSVIKNDVWSHIQASSDGTTMTIMIDGIISSTRPAPSTIFASPHYVLIGAWENNGIIDTPYNGIIDDLILGY